MCVFCEIVDEHRYFLENAPAVAFSDAYLLSSGHVLIVQRRHETDYLRLTDEEQQAVWSLVPAARDVIRRQYSPGGFNIGINVGAAGGQTIDHVHLHLIPRYPKDVPDPRGGVRWVIPDRAQYWEEQV